MRGFAIYLNMPRHIFLLSDNLLTHIFHQYSNISNKRRSEGTHKGHPYKLPVGVPLVGTQGFWQ